MGLYDRDYMKERNASRRGTNPNPNIDIKLIVVALVAFILGILVCKIIL